MVSGTSAAFPSLSEERREVRRPLGRRTTRIKMAGEVVLSCEPSTSLVPGQLAPHEERSISVEIVTRGELPGRHVLRVKATYASKPINPTTEGLFELTVTAD